MFTHILTLTRPNTSVQWYVPDPLFTDHIQTNYIDLGLILSRTTEVDPTGLVKVVRTVFVEKPAYYSMFIVDPTIQDFSVLSTTYNNQNAITLSVTVETDETHP